MVLYSMFCFVLLPLLESGNLSWKSRSKILHILRLDRENLYCGHFYQKGIALKKEALVGYAVAFVSIKANAISVVPLPSHFDMGT